MTSVMRSLIAGSKRRKTDGTTTSFCGPSSSSSSPSLSLAAIQITNRSYGIRRSTRVGRTRNGDRRSSREVDSSQSAPCSLNDLCIQTSNLLTCDDMRLVLIEAESRVLFDSTTVIPVERRVVDGARTLSSCKKLQFLRKRKDTGTIAQMLFGAVPTAAGSDSFKIHTLAEEEKMLVSKGFIIPRITREGTGDSVGSSDSDSAYLNTLRSLDGLVAKSRSTTSTPETFSRVRHISIGLLDDEEDGSACGSATLPRAFSPPHRLSRNRRRQMAHKTSLSENGAIPFPSGWKSRSRLSSCGSQTDEENGGRQVAVGLLFRFADRNFMFQHMPLIESEMSRLESRIINAASHTPTFLINVSQAWSELSETLCQLHNAPRLRSPVWLALNERSIPDRSVAEQFCNHLATLVQLYDTKHTGFFVSNLITAVLMHHMSWVASVASPPFRPELRQSHTDRSLFIGTALNDDAPSLGYNAQLAQYLELSGAVGPHRTAKSVIIGDDEVLITALCQVLSYFVRCSNIQHKEDERCWQLPLEQAFSPALATPDSAASPPSSIHIAFSPEKEEVTTCGISIMSTSCSMDSLPSVTTSTTHVVCVVSSDVPRLDLAVCDDVISSSSDELLSPTSCRPADGLGRSLFAGPLPFYNPHFVVSGVLKNLVNMDDTLAKMVDEVKCSDSASHRATASSMSSSQSSASCDVQMPDNVLIIADTNDWSVKVLSSEGVDDVPSPSEAVVSMLEEFSYYQQRGVHPHILLSHLEDSLSGVLGKSLSLVEMVAREPKPNEKLRASDLSPERVRTIVGCDHSDLRLIVNVAAVYWPPVLASVFG